MQKHHHTENKRLRGRPRYREVKGSEGITNVKSLRKKLGSRYGSAVTVWVEDGCIVVSGS